MNAVQDSAPSSSLLATMNGGKAKTTSNAEKIQDRFMTLLVSQMKNQDPLNPLDNAQVTSQLAQLSTVTGIDKLNSTLEALKGTYQTNESYQAASMIGHGVLVPGSKLTLVDGKSVFGAELTEPADKVDVTIKDASGKVVQTINLGAKEAGTLPLAWDGATTAGTVAANGQYTVEVTATRGGQKVTGAGALAFGEVVSVSTGAQGVKLNVPGMNPLSLSEVRQIL